MSQPYQMKLVIVGDGSIGKTCIMIRYTQNYFQNQYVPTVFDNSNKLVSLAGINVNLSLWDTAGQEEYSRLRSIAYPNTDIFLIAFSVVQPNSYKNAKKKWVPEIKKEVPNAHILFVGCKTDLRNSFQINMAQKDKPLQKQDIQNNLRAEFGCRYVECSALTNQGVEQVFYQAVRIVLASRGIIRQVTRENNVNVNVVNFEKQMGEEDSYCQGLCNLI